jgi:hypothetical protein
MEQENTRQRSGRKRGMKRRQKENIVIGTYFILGVCAIIFLAVFNASTEITWLTSGIATAVYMKALSEVEDD